MKVASAHHFLFGEFNALLDFYQKHDEQQAQWDGKQQADQGELIGIPHPV